MSHGIILISIVSFMFGALGTVFAVYIIITANNLHGSNRISSSLIELDPPYQNVHHLLDINILNIVIGILLVLSVLKIISSVLLFLGTTKEISGFVLAYFSYGVLLAIIIFLTALLEFIQGIWYIATITVIIFGIYVVLLHNVYIKYNNMQSIVFGITGHSLLINEEQTDLSTI